MAQDQTQMQSVDQAARMYQLQQNDINQRLGQMGMFGGEQQSLMQQMLNQQMQGLYLPYGSLQQIATGINAGTNYQPPQQANPYLQMGASALGGLLGGAGQQQAPPQYTGNIFQATQ
jgi:hypothetical protein